MRLEKLVGRTGHDERSCVQGRTERAHSCPGTRPAEVVVRNRAPDSLISFPANSAADRTGPNV